MNKADKQQQNKTVGKQPGVGENLSSMVFQKSGDTNIFVTYIIEDRITLNPVRIPCGSSAAGVTLLVVLLSVLTQVVDWSMGSDCVWKGTSTTMSETSNNTWTEKLDTRLEDALLCEQNANVKAIKQLVSGYRFHWPPGGTTASTAGRECCPPPRRRNARLVKGALPCVLGSLWKSRETRAAV